jgi:hypothetical protein
MRFKTKVVAQYILSLACRLRNEWERLINQKLGQGAGKVINKKRNSRGMKIGMFSYGGFIFILHLYLFVDYTKI